MRFVLVLCLGLSVCFNSFSKSNKREFRAAWIATVSNIDWPSKPGLPAEQQQNEFIHRLDQLKSMGCNAVIVQVRPSCDAFYDSPYEPWSRYLTGKQGQPPFPYYDPLKFMIEETHKRNMEFHAWFNPFRALTDSKKNPNPASHVTRQHPGWIINYGDRSYIDPGIPEARQYVSNVIMDVVKRYDIDGIHIDDYFYPYRIAGQEFGDQKSFNNYHGEFNAKDDWRRNNVSTFIQSLGEAIHREKAFVKYGISPFGVWRNASRDPEGSATRGGQTDYDDLFADVVLWMKKGWIDYLIPQLYWEHAGRAAPFEVLLPWWEAHTYQRHTYYGLGVYRMPGATHGPWVGTREIMWQLSDVRNMTLNPGYSFYSISSFDKLNVPLRDSIDRFNINYAFPPEMKWLDNIAPSAPVALKAIPSSQGTLLQWQAGNNLSKERITYAVYRFQNGENVDLEKAERIITVQSGKEFIDAYANKYKECKYVVTALDRLWNESKPSNTASTGY